MLATTIANASESVQWYRDGIAVPDAILPRYEIPHAFPEHSGTYHAVISNDEGTAQTRNAEITVDVTPPSPGALDLTFPLIPFEGTGINAISPLPDGRIAVGGEFTLPGTGIENFVILSATGIPDLSSHPFPGTVRALTPLSENRLAVGGSFPDRLTILDTLDGTPTPDQPAPPPSAVLCLLEHGDELLVGTLRGLYPASGAPAWITGRSITALTHEPGGEVIAGSASSPHILRFTSEGTPGPTFDPATLPSGPVSSLAPHASGFAVGGVFVNPAGNLRNFATYPEPSTTALNAGVSTLLPTPDGSLIIGGDFNCLGSFANTPRCVSGLGQRSIARLNADASPDPTFEANGFDGAVTALAIDQQGHLLVGGRFRFPYPFLTRLHLSGSPAPDPTIPPPPETSPQSPGLPITTIVGGSTSRTILPDETDTHLLATVPASEHLIQDLQIHLEIEHPDTAELKISLVSPSGERFTIFEIESETTARTSSRGLTHTTIALASPVSIDQALPPFSGTYTAPGGTSTLAPLRGTSPEGTWSLRIKDNREASAPLAILRRATLTFTYAPVPATLEEAIALPLQLEIPDPGSLALRTYTDPPCTYHFECGARLTSWTTTTPTLERTHRHADATETRIFSGLPHRFTRVRITE